MKRINLFIGVMLVLSVFTGCESNKQTNSSSSYNSEKSSQTKIETTVEKTTSAPDTQATTIQTEPTTEKPTEPPTEPPTEAPTEPPTEPPTEKPFSEYRTDITYDQLARTPDDYKNEDLVLRGKVIQVIEADFATQFRIAINDDYNCIIYDGNSHGHYFNVRGIYGDKVELFGPVRDGILRYRRSFID